MSPDTNRSEGRRFERSDRNRPRTNDQPNYQVQFDSLNAKMDKILALLTPTTPVETSPLESVLNETIIDELAEEVTEEKSDEVKPKVEAKPKKENAAEKPSPSKKKSK